MSTDSDWKLPPYTIEQVLIPFSQVMDWGIKDLGIPELWNEFFRGEDIRVAVLDTGQPVHKDLIEGLGTSKDFTGSTRGVKDMNGHGTHCAGIIGARHNELGTVGVAPMCEIICAKVLGDNGSGSTMGIVSGIDWAIQSGAKVISMSLGSAQPSQAIKSAIDRVPKSIILCCAAGNSGPGEVWDYPAAWPRSLSVASTNQARAVSQFSSRNMQVDIGAPGEKILSTWLDDQSSILSGTSMATPFIAGLAAMAVGYCKKTNRPDLNHDTFVQLLTSTADDIGPVGPDQASGYGLVNPTKFFHKLREVSPVGPPVIPPPTGEKPNVSISVSGSALPPGNYPVPIPG